MKKINHNIKIYRHSRHNNFFEGTIDDYKWFAIVKDDKVKGGMDIENLESGSGKIVRLCIYDDSRDVEGNPFLPSVTIKRTIYVNYVKGWKVFNLSYTDMVSDLSHYLTNIKTLHIV
ncbi:hypothetical protein QUF55_04255 [Clostridiaceae bacterium HSG29]|nr:hypothetical protein [Clostridiaceae bacterium HSG29]